MTDKRQLTEYLFVDKARIESYFEQLSSPVKYDDVPIWKVALGLAGPAVDRTSARQSRAYTMEEKIRMVDEHITSELLKYQGTHLDAFDREFERTPFVDEVLEARKVFIPCAGGTLGMWVSIFGRKTDWRTDRIALYLIEDYRNDDTYYNQISSYSSLRLLAWELSEHMPFNNPLDQLKEEDGLMDNFALDPVGSLMRIGAKFGPTRTVRALYRFRASCVELDVGRVMIGYPLIIQEQM